MRKKLEERREADAFRVLIEHADKIDFFSNDYLGVSKTASAYQMKEGSTGSRLMSGNAKRTEAIENELAAFYRQEAGLIFNSGYDANVGLFSCVPQKGDTVLYDFLIHASIRDGIKLSNASAHSFEHNNVAALEEKLQRLDGDVFVVVEGLYSMDGDAAPLNEMAAVCETYGAFLIVDEAHSGGICGEGGRGLTSELGLDEKVFAKVVTFGKAYGSHGAVVLGSRQLTDYLINFARSFMYTTALPLSAHEHLLGLVKRVESMDAERRQLLDNITVFKSEMSQSNLELIPSDSPIQCVIVPGNTECKLFANKILEAGIAVKAVLYPTVPKGKERLRFCIHAYNSKEEIKRLTELLNG